MKRFLLQMAGESASGKSTLARAIGLKTGAVVLDKDVIKARLLEEGLPEDTAGGLSYAVFFDVAASIMAQGFNLILDSPAFFTDIRTRGQEIAARNDAAYYIVRCTAPELAVLQQRMDGRLRMASQPAVAAFDNFSRPGTSPLREPHLLLDTRKPFEEYLAEALRYIGYDAG